MANLHKLTREQINEPTERHVFDKLTGLDDEWHVFHHYQWIGGAQHGSSKRGGRARHRRYDGEADFVLLHKDRGLLVLEVKGGDLELDSGVWWRPKHDGSRESLDPVEQVKDNGYALSRRLKEKVVPGVRIPWGYGIVVPHAREAIKSDIGEIGEPAGILWTEADLRDITSASESLCRTCNLHGHVDASTVSAIVKYLAPTVSVSRATREAALLADADLEAVTDRVINFTEDQVTCFARLQGTRRAVVYGRAGTGKTLLALERARRLADEGARVLLTCSRSALATSLRFEAAHGHSWEGRRQGRPEAFRYNPPEDIEAPPFVIESFKALLRAMVPEERRPLVDALGDAAGASPSVTLEEVADALALDRYPFDAVVVDEGQQVLPLWYDILEHLMLQGPDSPMYVFADPLQAVASVPADGERWTPPFDMPYSSLTLSDNCRNTTPIVEKLAAVGEFAMPPGGTPGPAVRLREVKKPRQTLQKLIDVLESLLDDGHDPDDIAIVPLAVSPRLLHDGKYQNPLKPRRLVDLLNRETRFVGRVRFAGLTPPVLAGEPRAVRVASSREFQGFESRVVIVVATTDASGAARDWTLREAYIAMSRARTVLVVICLPQLARILRSP